MSSHLNLKYNIPLEREYEGWLSSQIENYFSNIGVRCEVFAISPHDEKHFPSDINYFFRGKLIGLQLKRPKDKLQFEFKRNQQEKILKGNLPIYYALPTFLNSEFRKNTLEHFIFYKPEKIDFGINQSKTIYYLNALFSDKIKIDTKKIDVCRWGKFVEMVLECNIGKLLTICSKIEKRDIKISQILDEKYSDLVTKELDSSKNIFNLDDNPLLNSSDDLKMFNTFQEYVQLLKNQDKKESEDILFLILIKS